MEWTVAAAAAFYVSDLQQEHESTNQWIQGIARAWERLRLRVDRSIGSGRLADRLGLRGLERELPSLRPTSLGMYELAIAPFANDAAHRPNH